MVIFFLKDKGYAMQRFFWILVCTMISIPLAVADDGLITLKSTHTVNETLDRYQHAVEDKGMKVFARIDHAAAAKGVDMPLRPTSVLIFGNPKVGTMLMQSNQTAGIDLPLKLLAWQDEDGQVWIAYTDPAYLVQRHAITDRDPVVANMRKALNAFATTATGK